MPSSLRIRIDDRYPNLCQINSVKSGIVNGEGFEIVATQTPPLSFEDVTGYTKGLKRAGREALLRYETINLPPFS